MTRGTIEMGVTETIKRKEREKGLKNGIEKGIEKGKIELKREEAISKMVMTFLI